MEYIYIIENANTGKFYIGRTNDPAQRKRAHFSELRRGAHGNPRLQNSFNKHGEAAFEFKVVDSASADKIQAKEAEWFKAFDEDKTYLYNCHFKTIGGEGLARPHTAESKLKISEAIKDGTRKYIFDILDERYAGASIRKLAKKHNVSSETLLLYTPEWEQLRGLTMPKSVQEEASKQRVAEFVRLFMVVGDAALYELKSIGVSRRALTKYLPDFGLSFKDINLTKWRDVPKQKALDAIKMVNETGCTAMHAMKECGATVSSYYKYRGV